MGGDGDAMSLVKAALVPAVLFFALSPGILINIPPVDGQWWMSGRTSFTSALVAAILYGVILVLIARRGKKM
jgi:hypothetical protein